MENSAVVRLDKIEKVKRLIEEEAYTVSSNDIADKIINDIQLYRKIISEKE